MSSFSFKYYNISPKVMSEAVVNTLIPMIKTHNDSLGRDNQNLFIFNQIKKQRGSYRGICLGFGKETVKIVRYLINQSREKCKVLLQDATKTPVTAE